VKSGRGLPFCRNCDSRVKKDNVRFIAIDFETANSSRSSVCALGLVVVDGGEVVERNSWLVRPEPLVFDGFNIMIHGITADDVRNEPTFEQLWPEVFLPYFQTGPMLAHNASFDMSVLRRVLDQYGITYPHFFYYCTRVISKRCWPGLESYALDTVADHVRIEFEHHDPVEDAHAAALIAMMAHAKHGVSDLYHLSELLVFKPGELFPGGYRPCGVPYVGPGGTKLKDLAPTTTEFDCNHPFYEKVVVFTGALESMARGEAAQRVVNCGGRCADTMSRWVNFLVLGEQDYRRLRGQTKSAKMRKAGELLAKGVDIELIPESDFLEMLKS
jgi:DNA polymerase-3 subunit epsilon